MRFPRWRSSGAVLAGLLVIVNVLPILHASAQVTQTLVVSPDGPGVVTSQPAGISCEPTCSAGFEEGALVILTAVPDADASFVGWSGDCAGSNHTCQVLMDASRNVSATFAPVVEATIGSVDADFYANPTDSGAFTAVPSDTPEFSHSFPVVNFNAPPGVASCSNTTGVAEGTRPFTDVVPLPDGSCSTLVAEGDGKQAGVGDLASFQAVFTTTVTVSDAGVARFSFYSDDGWIMGVGPGPRGAEASYVRGPMVNAPAASTMHGYTVVGALNGPSSPNESVLEVAFPLPGEYPIELNYTECCSGTLVFTVQTNVASSHTVSVDVQGSGAVTSEPAGISCTSTCGSSFDHGEGVWLEALADDGWEFVRWEGAGCEGSSPFCFIDVRADAFVTATFESVDIDLFVSIGGAGSGSVTDDLGSIDCPDISCFASYEAGATVTLTATPAEGSLFTGWSGDCSGSDAACIVTMDQHRSVTATFDTPTKTLFVSTDGFGEGTVASDPAGIDCPTTSCDAGFDTGTTVTLTATAGPDSVFAGWSGDCSGTEPTCEVAMDDTRFVTATFQSTVTVMLTVETAGAGSGVVTSDPPGIDCGLTCTFAFTEGTTVVLHATPSAGSLFAGWSDGGCTGLDDCQVFLTGEQTVTARFEPAIGQVLILEGTVTDGANSAEAQKAVSHGFAVDVVDNDGWSAMTTEDFGSYRALILGDATCGGSPPTAAEENAATWGAAVDGNIVIIGTDPVFHYGRGGGDLTESGIAFATAQEGATGAYVTLSCYYHDTDPQTPVPLLDAFAPDGFTVTGVGCYNDAHIVATHPALAGLDDGDLSNWSCSVHEAFDSWPAGFQVLAIAKDFGGIFTAPDGTVGTPYILASGTDIHFTAVRLTPVEATNHTGTQHTVTATVTKDGVLLEGVEVTFTVVDGPNIGTTGTGTTEPDGAATFSYSSAAAGIDTIEATIVDEGQTVTSNSVTKAWLDVRTLQVAKVGSGTGGVVSEPAGIDCGADCEQDLATGSEVTLTATADAGSVFTGWGGDCAAAGTDPVCVLAMGAERSVTATFDAEPPLTHTLTVAKDGTGSGAVTSDLSGIDCGTDCEQGYEEGTVVTLTASPNAGSRLDAWSGCDTTDGPVCTVTMDQDRTVTATFVKVFTLTVTKVGTGTGTVTSPTLAIDCGTTCEADFDEGSLVSLTAAADPGSSFQGWSGDCETVLGDTCTASMTQARSVTATFDLSGPHALTVEVLGAGSVSSDPEGISCPTDCEQDIEGGTKVTLTATPDSGETFLGWTGDCATTDGPTCTVSMDGPKTVRASFSAPQCIAYPDFASAPDLLVLGDAAIVDGVLRLTPAEGGQTGTVWHGAKVAVARGFVSDFDIRFTEQGGIGDADGAGADGITFAIQNAALGATGSAGGSIGYEGLADSLVVELDTFDNGTGFGDPNGNHVAVHTRGPDPNGPGEDSLLGVTALDPEVLELQDGAAHRVRIAYDPAGAGALRVFVDDLSTAVLTVAVDLDATISLDDGTAWVGFTSATGAGFENHDVLDWFHCGGTALPPTLVLTPQAATNPVGAEHTVQALLTDDGEPVPGVGVTFSVLSGPNAGTTGSATTDVNGRAGFAYTGEAAGTDEIRASVVLEGQTLVSNTATKSWTVTHTLTVTKVGTGTGTVTSPTLAIDCGTTCEADFDEGSLVSLTAAADPGSSFQGWSGDCETVLGDTCTVSMTQARSVTATFELVQAQADLSVAKADSPDPVTVGAELTYTIVVRNAGPDEASGVVVTDELPAGVDLVSADPGCTSDAGTVTCEVATLASGGEATFHIVVSPTEPNPALLNTASVRSASNDPTSSNDSDGATTQVVSAGFTLDVGLDGSGSGSITSDVGSIDCPATLCTDVYGSGEDVTLTAVADAGSVFVGWGGDCASFGTDPECTLTMDGDRVVTATFDEEIGGFVDLAITKSDQADPVVPGEPITWTITVTNNGTTDATGVVVSDPLPANVNLVSADASQGSCTGTTSVSCDLGTIGAGLSASVTIVADTTEEGQVQNEVSVTSTETDTNLDDNAEAETTTVAEQDSGLNPFIVVQDTDIAYAGFGGMRGDGTGTLTLEGTTGIVTAAYLYWQGPTDSTDNAVNATVSFSGTEVTGTNIGFSNDNCWSFANSQAYRADVTSLVSGDGAYELADFVKPGAEINGVSLVVFFNDGNDANDRDVHLFDGNDSNITNPFDTDGWDVVMADIAYEGGTASLDLHVSDGQAYGDDALVLNGSELEPAGGIFQGDTVPGGGGALSDLLWDIRSFDITSYLSVGSNALQLTTGVAGDCLSAIVAAVNVSANAVSTHTLTVAKDGTGSGAITSDLSGIDCGAECEQHYEEGTVVTLTASPNAGSRLDAWSGCDATDGPVCTVTMDQDRTVTATFVKVFTLAVLRAGTGTGTVTSPSLAIDCGTTCEAGFDEGSVVTLTATPDPGSSFEGWTGPCDTVLGTTCTVLMIETRTVTATFEGPVVISGVTELTDPVGRFERFEADIELTRTYEDPFDPDVVTVDVTFTAPSGDVSTMPAFWFQDFEVRPGTETFEIYDAVGDPTWRVRFAPVEVGTFIYVVHVLDGFGGDASSAPMTFEVTETDDPGFVRVDGQDGRFLRFDRGAPYVPLGHNAAFDTANPPLNGVSYYEALFAGSFAPQENWTRVWMTDFNRSALEWGPGHWSGFYDGVGRYSLPAAWRMDGILELAEAHGLYVQLVLNDHGQFSTQVNARWQVRCTDPSDGCTPGEPGYDPGNPYSDAVGGPVPADRPDLFFSNAEARDLFERRLRYVVARWGGYTNVMAWELFNEVQFVGSETHNPYNDAGMWADVLDWHAEMADYLGDVDPFDHLVTTSSDPAPPGRADVGGVPGIDLVQVHDYTPNPAGREVSIAGYVTGLQDAHGKPVIAGEFGLGSGDPEAAFDPTTFGGTAEDRDHLSQGTHVHNAVWAGALTASGSMTWFWDIYMAAEPARHRTAPDFPLAPRIFPAIAAYLEGEDWATLGLDRSGLTTSDGLVAFGLDDGTEAFAWVRDGENTFGSGAGPGDLEARTISGATLTIADMVDGRYDVEVWDPYGDGGLLQTLPADAVGGELVVSLPDFTRDLALKVRQGIRQETLTLTKAGNGTGTVASDPGGIDCGPACASDSAEFVPDSLVRLTTAAEPGSEFVGWGGEGCGGTGDCLVIMDRARSVTATFQRIVGFAVDDLTVAEGDVGTLEHRIVVRLSEALGAPATVRYAVVNGTATYLQDYRLKAPTPQTGILTFAPGEIEKVLPIVVYGDKKVEDDETFFVDLSSPSGARILDSLGVGTIVNDDVPQLAFGNASVKEGNAGTTKMSFTVTLDAATTVPVDVSYRAVDDTATRPSDYSLASGTVHFDPLPAAQSVKVDALVVGDLVPEPDERFFLELFDATNAQIAASRGTGTIVNDDKVTVSVANDPVVTEGNPGDSAVRELVFLVNLSTAIPVGVTVHVATGGGTATAGADYQAVAADLAFPPNATSREVRVHVIDDLRREPDETVLLTLSAPTVVTIGDGQGVGTIRTDGDVCTMVGTEGADLLVGTSGDDVICGLGANDDLRGMGGNDLVFAGTGNDTVTGGEGNDTLYGEAGNDHLFGEAGGDAVFGGSDGDLLLSGGLGADRVEGEAGSDIAFGDAGADTMLGGDGDDVLHGDDGDAVFDDGDAGDFIVSGLGSDTVFGEGGGDEVWGDLDNNANDTAGSGDEIRGGPGNDVAYGTGGNDVIRGDDGADVLYGGAGNDDMAGSDGDDDVRGGGGDDLLNGNAQKDELYGASGNDRLHGGPEGGNYLNGGPDYDICSAGPPPGDTRVNCEAFSMPGIASSEEPVALPTSSPRRWSFHRHRGS